MRLTEKRASELVAEWTSGCKGIAPAPPMMTAASPFTHSRMVVVANRQKLETISTAKEYGLQLRRTMEGLNALSVCVGFDPEENPGFWRREIFKLAIPLNKTPLQQLTSGLLSRFDIDIDLDDRTSSSSVAYGLATCLAMDTASPAMAVRQQVITQLHDYLLATPPPLDIIVSFRSRSLDCCMWRMCMAVIQDLVSVRAMAPALVNAEALKIAIGHGERSSVISADDDACFVFDTLRDVAKVMPVEVVGIHILNPQRSFPTSRLRSLVSGLAAADTVQSMSWHTKAISDVTAAILCSVVPYMRSLKSLNIIETLGRPEGYLSRKWLSTLGYQWLAFALKWRQMQGLELEMSTEYKPNRFEVFVRTMNDEQTFACLIPEVVREATAFISFPLGTSAKPTAGTPITQELLVDHHDQAEGVSASGDRLDVLACSGHRCIVVMPGYGLMWIERVALKSWDRPLHRRHVPIPPPLGTRTIMGASVVISTGSCGLDLSSQDTFPIAKIPTLGSSLRSLILRGCQVQTLTKLLGGPGNGQFTVEALCLSGVYCVTSM